MILRKKDVFIILILFVTLIAALSFSLNALSTAVSGSVRKIPIYSVECEKKQVALTFNAAWDDSYVEEILSTLNKYSIKASFFFVGDWVEKYPIIVKKIYDEGHSMGNHSDTHRDMTKLGIEEISKDITACNEKISMITGESPKYFRAPSGSYDNKTIKAAESLGMFTIQWDVDSIDWKNPTADTITERIVSKVKNGSIVLFHLGKENTAEALPSIIMKLREDGYSFVTLDELIYKDNYNIDNNGRQIVAK